VHIKPLFIHCHKFGSFKIAFADESKQDVFWEVIPSGHSKIKVKEARKKRIQSREKSQAYL
jgi:hypothetical protein